MRAYLADIATAPSAGVSARGDRPDAEAEAVFAGLDAMARDLGRRLGKRIELMTRGGDVALPAETAPALRRALEALVRDVCDHGVETAAERAATHKPALAVLRLSAFQRGGDTLIELSDDGRGWGAEPADRPEAGTGPAAAEAGLSLGGLEAQMLTFGADLATALAAAPAARPGLGLELAREAAETLGGRFEVVASPGRGAQFTLVLPPAGRRRSPVRLRGAA